jgi:ribonuclease HI
MPLDPRAIHIYTDGSCYKNPGGESGAAALVDYPEYLSLAQEQILDFGCGESTNNRMELLACVRALRWVRDNRPWPGVNRVQIVCDSQYVLENLSRASNWKANDWRNFHGEPKKNIDLWKQLLKSRVIPGIRVDFQYRKGKTSPVLKAVDKAAKAAAKRGGLYSDSGFKRGKISRSRVRGSATLFEALGQTTVIQPYRKDPLSRGENQIRFHVYDERSKTHVAKHYAYATDLQTAELHRHHHYRVRFNNNPRYPRIEEICDEVIVAAANK